MPETLVIADDITGANDIGIMYAKAGLATIVYSYKGKNESGYQACDVLILDTDSRFDSRERAYEKVYHAVEQAKDSGIRQYFNKQCSVFRGNIGAEFDAMLDALGASFAVIVLGFPKNGRTTRHSIHYVYEELLHESQFKNDPVHPMTESNLVHILQRQTNRLVTAIHYEVYEKGPEAVRQALQEAKEKHQYCIMDVRDQKDLLLLAELLQDEKVICGSSALAEYLAVKKTPGKGQLMPANKTFCLAGSLTPQTFSQIVYMKRQGYPVYEFDTRKLIDQEEHQKEIDRLMKIVDNEYKSGNFVLVHSMNQKQQVEETKALFQKKGCSNTEVSTIVSKALAQLGALIIKKHKIHDIISCGGDTSAAVCEELEVEGMEILEEIETGLPRCRSVNAPYYRLILKSGSFGSERFIEKAMEKR